MSNDIERELDIPDGMGDAEAAIEVLRAWIADGALHVIFDPNTFAEDFAEWGRLLSEISHHIAQAAAMEGEMSQDEALAAIRDGYLNGLETWDGQRDGQIRGRTTH
ncbi:MAG: DUF5076 domain-containing protein [Alphaproteobacteria bacterium]|nr:DUF5076 domain-containing protein [Alphaproteobacteria bacterium]